MTVREIKAVQEFKDIIDSDENKDKLIVIDSYATWCGPCKMIGPKVQEMAREYKENVIFLKFDVDEAEDLVSELSVKAMPTFFFFKNGKKVDELQGANKDKLVEMIKQHM